MKKIIVYGFMGIMGLRLIGDLINVIMVGTKVQMRSIGILIIFIVMYEFVLKRMTKDKDS